MKKIIFAFAIFLIINGCQSDTKEFWQQQELTSKATYVNTFRFIATINGSDTIIHYRAISNQKTETKLNSFGQLEESTTYFYDTITDKYKPWFKNINIFNYDGLVDTELNVSLLTNDTTIFKVLDHDSKGNPTLEKLISGEAVGSTVTSFDNSVKIVKSFHDHKPIVEVMFAYDNCALNFYEITLFGDSKSDTLVRRVNYDYIKFDNKGNWIMRISENKPNVDYIIEKREIIY